MFNYDVQKLSQKYSKFNYKPYLTDCLEKEDVLQLKEAFDLFDIEQRGYLIPEQLKEQLNKIGIYTKNQSLDELMSGGVKKINFFKFIQLFGSPESCKSEEDTKKLYRIFINDDDLEKKITRKDFERIIKELQLEVGDSEIEDMISSANPSVEGVINFEEFRKVMMKVKE